MKAKAKARANVRHRPAAPIGLRRPAAGLDQGDLTPWARGIEVELSTLTPLDLELESFLVVTEADYFGGRIKVAGMVTKLELDPSGQLILLRPREQTARRC